MLSILRSALIETDPINQFPEGRFDANSLPQPTRPSGDHSLAVGWNASLPDKTVPAQSWKEAKASAGLSTLAIDPFFLFACYVEWEQAEDPSAGWELIAAAQSTHENTRPGAGVTGKFAAFGGKRIRIVFNPSREAKTLLPRGERHESTVRPGNH